jgi:hypothetical protein
MFLKLTLYDEDPNCRLPIMINMDKAIGYGDYYDAKYLEDPITYDKILHKNRISTCLYIGESRGSTRDIYVMETMEEINLKMAQLERRKQ